MYDVQSITEELLVIYYHLPLIQESIHTTFNLFIFNLMLSIKTSVGQRLKFLITINRMFFSEINHD